MLIADKQFADLFAGWEILGINEDNPRSSTRKKKSLR